MVVTTLNTHSSLFLARFVNVVLSLTLVVVVAGAPMAWADDLPDLGESARAELSPQIERKLGESIMNEIRLREPSYVDDPEIND